MLVSVGMWHRPCADGHSRGVTHSVWSRRSVAWSRPSSPSVRSAHAARTPQAPAGRGRCRGARRHPSMTPQRAEAQHPPGALRRQPELIGELRAQVTPGVRRLARQLGYRHATVVLAQQRPSAGDLGPRRGRRIATARKVWRTNSRASTPNTARDASGLRSTWIPAIRPSSRIS